MVSVALANGTRVSRRSPQRSIRLSISALFQTLTEAEQRGSHHHRLALMSTRKKKPITADPEAIDRLVVSQSEDESAWEAPIRVKRSKPASLSIPGELAARAAFIAKLHREEGVDTWVARIVRERVELEERAFAEAKRKLASED
jgi:hypothetical protein